MPMRPHVPLPSVLSLLACDGLHRDPTDGKTSVLGVLTSLSASHFPFTYPCIAVYAELTNGHGRTPIAVRLVDVEGHTDPAFSWQRTVAFQTPRDIALIRIAVKNVVFPGPGHYYLQVEAADTLLIERRLWVRQAPTGV